MHKQDENDLEILPSFIRRHVKILWNQFFCIYIIFTRISISAEKVYVFAKNTTLRMIRGRPFDLGVHVCVWGKKGGGGKAMGEIFL
jgi:hypothetical protein